MEGAAPRKIPAASESGSPSPQQSSISIKQEIIVTEGQQTDFTPRSNLPHVASTSQGQPTLNSTSPLFGIHSTAASLSHEHEEATLASSSSTSSMTASAPSQRVFASSKKPPRQSEIRASVSKETSTLSSARTLPWLQQRQQLGLQRLENEHSYAPTDTEETETETNVEDDDESALHLETYSDAMIRRLPSRNETLERRRDSERNTSTQLQQKAPPPARTGAVEEHHAEDLSQHTTMERDSKPQASVMAPPSSVAAASSSASSVQPSTTTTSSVPIQHRPLLPLSELIDRLAVVNEKTVRGATSVAIRPGSSRSSSSNSSQAKREGKGRKKKKFFLSQSSASSTASSLMEVDEIARILHHINLCEAAKMEPRWDQIQQRIQKQHQQQDTIEFTQAAEGFAVAAAHADHGIDSTTVARATESASTVQQLPPGVSEEDFLAQFVDSGSETSHIWGRSTDESKADEQYRRFDSNISLGSDEGSISLDALVMSRPSLPVLRTDNESACFSLEADPSSCNSSITWYGDVDLDDIGAENEFFEEIEVSSEEGDIFALFQDNEDVAQAVLEARRTASHSTGSSTFHDDGRGILY